MRRINSIIIALLAVVAAAPASYAQSGINSPYTRYGIGQLADQSASVNRAMAGTGVGMRIRNSINTLNPATYSTVDTLTFLLDAGFSLQNGNYSENGVRLNARNASFDYLAMQFRLVRNLGFSVGMLPFSKVGYAFSTAQVVRDDEDGEIVSTSSSAGEGGLHQYYAGLGWRMTKFISLGANLSMIDGDILHEIDNTYSESSIYSRQKVYSADIRALKSDFGIQLWHRPSEEKMFALGFTLSPPVTLHSDAFICDNLLTSSTIVTGDTVRMTDAFRLPLTMAAGASYSTDRLLVALDAKYQKWSDGRFFGEGGTDCLRFSAGAMFCPDRTSKGILKHSTYRGGVAYTQPYFKVGGSNGPAEFKVSAGMSIPIMNRYNNLSDVNISGEYVHVKASGSSAVVENYLRLNIGISFNELWFMKWQVQ